MWKLTITRRYKDENSYSSYEREDKMYFEAKHMEELVIIVEKFAEFATDGEFEYTITKKEGGEE